MDDEKKYEFYDPEYDTYTFRGEVLHPERTRFDVVYRSEHYNLTRLPDTKPMPAVFGAGLLEPIYMYVLSGWVDHEWSQNKDECVDEVFKMFESAMVDDGYGYVEEGRNDD